MVEKINKNSLLHWFPKIKNLGIPVPDTRTIEVSHGELIRILDGDASGVKRYIPLIKKTIEELGGPPVFMRTDHTSAKHDYINSCFLEKDDEKTILNYIYRLIEFSEMAGIVGLPCNAIVVREFLDLEYGFRAFNSLPIARERRYFIRNGKVQCHHPYWPEEAIRFWKNTPPENWREKLRELNHETDEEVKLLSEYALKVAKVMDGYWSVDFAMAKNGKWYLIDMALGEMSWHPEKCPYATF